MNKFVIIVAAGSSKRMGGNEPKQFRLIAHRPMLMHTIDAFARFSSEIKIIVVLPATRIKEWTALCDKYNFVAPHAVTKGGTTRGFSVKNGLNLIKDSEGIVAIHDGARPLVDERMIAEGFELAARTGTAIPCVPVTDSLRLIEPTGSRPFPREHIRAVQTPQCFELNMIRKAYAAQDFMSFSDDAQLIERSGIALSIFEGDPRNIKITIPDQLIFADLLLKGNA